MTEDRLDEIRNQIQRSYRYYTPMQILAEHAEELLDEFDRQRLELSRLRAAGDALAEAVRGMAILWTNDAEIVLPALAAWAAARGVNTTENTDG
jgi:hypothetical protein